MKLTARFSPINSIIFVADFDVDEIPEISGDKRIYEGQASVAIGTLTEIDGETTIILSDGPVQLEGDSMEKVLDRTLPTPSKSVSVMTALDEAVLTMPTETTETVLEIWTNDDRHPDLIQVFVKPSR